MSDDTLNPKDIIGRQKLPTHLWPATATAYGALGFLEGMTKYGRVNYRATPVAASVYYAAALRHLADWFEGEEYTKEGGPHLGNALACIAIIVDAKVNGTLVDDRQFTPMPGAYSAMVKELTELAKKLVANVTPAVAPKHWDARDNRPEETKPSCTITKEELYERVRYLDSVGGVTLPDQAKLVEFGIVLPKGWSLYSWNSSDLLRIELLVPEDEALSTQGAKRAKAYADILRNANPSKTLQILWDEKFPRLLEVGINTMYGRTGSQERL